MPGAKIYSRPANSFKGKPSKFNITIMKFNTCFLVHDLISAYQEKYSACSILQTPPDHANLILEMTYTAEDFCLKRRLSTSVGSVQAQKIPWKFRGHCGIISKIKVLHLKIKVYMKNIAVFTH